VPAASPPQATAALACAPFRLRSVRACALVALSCWGALGAGAEPAFGAFPSARATLGAAPRARAALAANEGGERVQEYAAKAAFLVNFAKFIKWPPEVFESASSPLVVGVLGPDPFGPALDAALDRKEVGGRRLVAQRYRTLKELGRCHLLFVSEELNPQLPAILAQCVPNSVFVVCDVDGQAARGATAGFYIEKKKIRFEINPDAARRSRLEVSSQLLKLARLVKDDPRPEDR
jgi:hypothetical protein